MESSSMSSAPNILEPQVQSWVPAAPEKSCVDAGGHPPPAPGAGTVRGGGAVRAAAAGGGGAGGAAAAGAERHFGAEAAAAGDGRRAGRAGGGLPGGATPEKKGSNAVKRGISKGFAGFWLEVVQSFFITFRVLFPVHCATILRCARLCCTPRQIARFAVQVLILP